MKTIVFYNHKGGTGKTSLSLMTARYLAACGRRVLAADYDPQKSLTSHMERLDGATIGNKTSLSVIMEECSLDEAVVRVKENLYLLPAEDRLRGIQGSITVTSIQTSLNHAEQDFDYCIIDDAPSWSTLTQATLLAADVVIIPTLPASDEMDQTIWTLGRTKSIKNAQSRILLNQWKGSKLDQEVLDLYRDRIQEFLLESRIPPSSIVRRYTDTGEQINVTAKVKMEFMKAFGDFIREALDENAETESF